MLLKKSLAQGIKRKFTRKQIPTKQEPADLLAQINLITSAFEEDCPLVIMTNDDEKLKNCAKECGISFEDDRYKVVTCMVDEESEVIAVAQKTLEDNPAAAIIIEST